MQSVDRYIYQGLATSRSNAACGTKCEFDLWCIGNMSINNNDFKQAHSHSCHFIAFANAFMAARFCRFRVCLNVFEFTDSEFDVEEEEEEEDSAAAAEEVLAIAAAATRALALLLADRKGPISWADRAANFCSRGIQAWSSGNRWVIQ